MAAPPYLNLPEKIDDLLLELAKEKSSTRYEERHHNYRIIYSTIYYKFSSDEDGILFNKFYSAYWRKIFGGHYRDYIQPLLDAKIIDRDGQYYAINSECLLKFKGKIKTIDSARVIDDTSFLFKKTRHAYETLKFDYSSFLCDLEDSSLKNQTYQLIDIKLLPKDLKLSLKYLDSSKKHYKTGGNKLKTKIQEKGVDISSVIYSKGYLHLYPIKFFVKNKYSALEENARIMDYFLKQENKTFYSHDTKKTGRVFTSLTNITSLALPYITIDNEQLVGLDFKSSQFAILANILKQLNEGEPLAKFFKKERGNKQFIIELKHLLEKENTKKDDLITFYNDVLNGDFYSNMGSLLGTDYRFLTKQLAFEFVFSKPPKTKTLFELKFNELYPTVYGIIGGYKKIKQEIDKKEGYKQFSIMLQSIESEILLDHVYPAVTKYNKIKALTKHDSILVKNSQADEAESIMSTKLKTMNFNIGIKKEFYKKIEPEDRTEIEENNLIQLKGAMENEDYEVLLTTWSETRNFEDFDINILLSLIEEDPYELKSKEDNKVELISRINYNNKYQIPLTIQDIDTLTIQLDYYQSLLNI